MSARAADPSMEEILASIRRIISDDMPQQRPSALATPRADPSASLPRSEAPASARVEPLYPSESPRAASFEPTAPRAPEPQPFAGRRPAEPTLVDLPSMEDAIEAEVADALRGTLAEPLSGAPRSVDEPAVVPTTSSFTSYARPSEPQQAGQGFSPRPATTLPPRPAFSFSQNPAPRAPLSASPTPRAVEPDRLVSQPTNAAVAASFGTLARTMMTGNSRSLEDVVAELLRPMLRNWLDDNLPTIVERLVRAEIERVSRGGR